MENISLGSKRLKSPEVTDREDSQINGRYIGNNYFPDEKPETNFLKN